MNSGPIIVGFDGTPAAQHALTEAAELFAPRRALVVVVWEAGRAFDLTTLPTQALEPPPITLDIRRGFELDQAMYEAAQRLAERGAAIGRDRGLDAEGLAVADDVTVADTLVRLAKERAAQAIVVGAHGHSALTELILGSTSRDVVRRAPCPVVIVRGEEPR
jgi:nucleotide-binding universal stress UspA family protein